MSDRLLGGLGALVVLFTLAVTVSVALVLRARDRRRLLTHLAAVTRRPRVVRADGEGDGAIDEPREAPSGWQRLAGAFRSRIVSPMLERLEPVARTAPATPKVAARLVLAGYEDPAAPVVLRLTQLLGAATCAVAGAMLVSTRAAGLVPAIGVIGALLGGLAPLAVLDRQVATRQQRIRHGLPDALDLLVVCVEAGVSLEMAIQRVGRELGRAHPALASELADMSRRLAAGVPREQAFQSLHLRTGVDDLRTLATHLIQSERWGTSLATVLRTAAQELRRRRRRAAEQRAATAATRMLAPLALCIFPTIFVVILGPAALRIMAAFREMAQ